MTVLNIKSVWKWEIDIIFKMLIENLLPIWWDSLQRRHNGHDGVSNHQPHQCLLNRLFRRRSKKTSKLRVIGLCVGNSPGTGEFPAQMAINAENVSIWWRHHVTSVVLTSWISSITGKISWIVGWPWSNHVCECASMSACNWFYNLIHGPQNKYWYFLSGNLDFGLEKSWKNHGTFSEIFVGTPRAGNSGNENYSTYCEHIFHLYI